MWLLPMIIEKDTPFRGNEYVLKIRVGLQIWKSSIKLATFVHTDNEKRHIKRSKTVLFVEHCTVFLTGFKMCNSELNMTY